MRSRILLIAAVNLLLVAGALSGTASAPAATIAGTLGITRSENVSPGDFSRQIAAAVEAGELRLPGGSRTPLGAGLPAAGMSSSSAFSAAVMTALGGRQSQFDEVTLLGDWDGREDLVADIAGKVDDFSRKAPAGADDFMITRVAFSEHTVANGFAENIFYYGDNFGNVYVASTSNLGQAAPAPNVLAINLPTILNAFGALNSDDQIVVTGLGVSPVVDLTSWANVNGAFSSFSGRIGEALYVTFWDSGSGFRSFSDNRPIRSGLLAFPIADSASPATNPPGILSAAGFPVTVGGAFGVAFSIFANVAGVAVDDDGSVYFHQVDLVRMTGGNIVKVADTGTNQDRSAATSGFLTINTLTPAGGNYGTSSGPAFQTNRFTNYSGTSTLFGDIVSLAAGPGNILYAAVARSYVEGDDEASRRTEGLFPAAPGTGATPSMIISFADASGSFDTVHAPPGFPYQPPLVNPVGAGPGAWVIGNLDSDGTQDLITANGGTNTVSILMGDGVGGYRPATAAVVGSNPEAVMLADIDADGKLDVLTANAGSNDVSILRGNGDGTFGPASSLAVGAAPKTLNRVDVSGDGKPDLLTANAGSNDVSVLLSNGDGTFQPAINSAAGGAPFVILSGLLDAGATIDLLTLNAGSGDVTLLSGNGDGSFSAPVSTPVGGTPTGMGTANLDGDAFMDLAVSVGSTGRVVVLRGNGDGTFQAPLDNAVGANPQMVTVVPLNGDAAIDLVTVNAGSNDVSVLLGVGDGTFQPAVNYPVGAGPTALAFGNFDGTPPADLVTVDTGSGTVSILRGNADGTFQPAFSAATGAGPVRLGLFSDWRYQRPLIVTLDKAGNSVSILHPLTGAVPAPDGLADPVVAAGVIPGVNNFRVFAMGQGPDLRSPGVSDPVFGSVRDTLKLDFQVDHTVYSGLAVDENNSVYVISGGTPAGVGRDPSPGRGEILLFPDLTPFDRRADYLDLRSDTLPDGPLAGANIGDGDSDRFDHLFWAAPLDGVTVTPSGVTGLARGFLMYLNRTRTAAVFPALPNGTAQGDDSVAGPIFFEEFDPGHQVAGGNDQTSPFRGDDSDGWGSPPLAGPVHGGFEFNFGGVFGGLCTSPWNAFNLNSNGSISFGVGDATKVPGMAPFLTGPPKIAPAWADLNPSSRAGGFLNTFPVQALGFSGVNSFVVRWINVPVRGGEPLGSRNSFTVTLWDDGTGVDENSAQPLNPANPIGNNAVPFDTREGPTDLVFPAPFPAVGDARRYDQSGFFSFGYGFMDLLGAPVSQALSGYSIGGQPALPPDICETNLSLAAGRARAARVWRLGEGVSGTIFELFDGGRYATATEPAVSEFDLRAEGNDQWSATPLSQADPNRGRVDFEGITCAAPPVFGCLSVPCPAIAFEPAWLAPATPGVPYGAGFYGTGDSAPYSFWLASGTLPAGTSLAWWGQLSGTPSVSGKFPITVGAVDEFGCVGTRDYTLGSYLFYDFFDDGALASNWVYRQPAWWSETSGYLVGAPTGRGAAKAVAQPAFAGLNQGTVEGVLRTAAGGKATLIGWYKNGGNAVQVTLLETKDAVQLTQVARGRLVMKAKVSAPILPDTDYRVAVAFDGSRFVVSLNGAAVITKAKARRTRPVGTVGFKARKPRGSFNEILVY